MTLLKPDIVKNRMKKFFSSYFIFLLLLISFSAFTNISNAIDNVSKIIDKIEDENKNLFIVSQKEQKQLLDLINNKQKNNTNNNEQYAGMVGDKKFSKGLNIDLYLKNTEDNIGSLIINGKDIENENIVKTYSIVNENENRFILDVFFKNIKDKNNVVNFTYQMPKNVRLKYGQQSFGYRIAIDLPKYSKIISKSKQKDAIFVKIQYKDDNYKNIDNKINTNNNLEKTIKTNKGFLIKADNNIQFKHIKIEHKKPIVIVIDAGHGGIDSGAISVSKKKEKDITLMYAKKLKQFLIDRGFVVKMTRNKDINISLENRVKFAKIQNADVYISLHTDSHNNSKISGTTVYRLSNLDVNNNEWKRFYNKNYLPDNYIDYFNNYNILDILIDLSHTILSKKSSILVDNILLSFKKDGICRNCRYGQRSFAVLRGLNMISILIEIGYISNKEEEKKILTNEYVDKFCKNLTNTLEESFITI